METVKPADKILKILLKDIGSAHTPTSLSKDLNMSRWGAWKILKSLERDKLVILDKIGTGKTGIHKIRLNLSNIILKKNLSLSLTKDAFNYERWRHDFAELEGRAEFVLLYGSVLHSLKDANDIDIAIIAKKSSLSKIDDTLFNIQNLQSKKIHSIVFTEEEFRTELRRPNRAFLDAIRKGVILFGQENFITFMSKLLEQRT